jgi:hypothetical protein
MARMMMIQQQEMINSRKFDEPYQHQNQHRNRLLDEEQINNSGEVLENSRNERPSDDDEGIEGLYLNVKLIIYDMYQQIFVFSKTGHDEPNHRHPHEHHNNENDDDHDVPDPTKISQDRTMILVPERSCPSGQRRDARGYCRRLVKIRTNYEYGPPPPLTRSSSSNQNGGNNNNNNNNNNNSLRPIPIRYYYSRIVTIPAFQFFYPNVRV